MTDYFPPPRDLPPGSAVWAYLRDSGGPTQGNSVTQQDDEIRSYCDRHGLVLVDVFRDVAKSAGSVISRSEFERMIDRSEVKELRPRGLLIWNFARFSRDSKDSTLYKALLRKRGVIIHSLTDPIPDDEFASRIVETVIDLANEEKRRQNSRDVKRGLRALVKAGYSPGIPPRGYKSVQVEIGVRRDGKPRIVGKWEPDPELWDSVVLAWQLRAEGKSYREIQAATGGKIYQSINCWHTFLKNKAYLGIGVSGDIEVQDHHPPAVNFETWQAVQRLRADHPLSKNHPRHPRRVGSPSLLTSYSYCIECGSAMTHTPGHKGHTWRYYLCGKKDRQGAKACPSRRVGERAAEDAILNAVIDQVLSPDYLEEVIETARAQFSDASDIERQITLAKRHEEDLRIAINRALNAIEKTGSDSAVERLKQREAERSQVNAEIDRLDTQLAAGRIEITPEAMGIVLNAWRDQLIRARETKDIRFIRSWLYRFVSRVDLGYNHARIHYTYPLIDLTSRNARAFRGGTKRHSSECFLFYDPRPRRGDVIRIPVGAQKDIHQSVFYFTTRVPAGGMLFESPWGHKR